MVSWGGAPPSAPQLASALLTGFCRLTGKYEALVLMHRLPKLRLYLQDLWLHVFPVQHRTGMYSRNPHKEPVFISTLRLKFNLLSPLNKNPPEAETGTRFLYNKFLKFRIPQNFHELLHSDQNSSVAQKTA